MHRNDFYDMLQEKLTECLFAQITDILGTLTFVQVGAADGVACDPIYDMIKQGRWTGVLIDALEENCQSLKVIHAGAKQIRIVNLVVSDRVGEVDFYAVIDEKNQGYNRLSSMSYDVISKHKKMFVSDIEDRLQIRRLHSDTLENVCISYQIANPDAIFVDAEGADDIIVQSFNYNRFVPHIIFFEHMHVPVDRLMKLNGTLEAAGLYRVCLWADTLYISQHLLQDECIKSIVDVAKAVFEDRDDVWGNGNWYRA